MVNVVIHNGIILSVSSYMIPVSKIIDFIVLYRYFVFKSLSKSGYKFVPLDKDSRINRTMNIVC